jgi:hypothetical protein
MADGGLAVALASGGLDSPSPWTADRMEDLLMGQSVDPRPVVYVHTDHSPDAVRTFYEIPDALVQRIRLHRRLDRWPREQDSDPRTFTQALADALPFGPQPLSEHDPFGGGY